MKSVSDCADCIETVKKIRQLLSGGAEDGRDPVAIGHITVRSDGTKWKKVGQNNWQMIEAHPSENTEGKEDKDE